MPNDPVLHFQCPQCSLYSPTVYLKTQPIGQFWVAKCGECNFEFDWRPQLKEHYLFRVKLSLRFHYDETVWGTRSRSGKIRDEMPESWNHEHCDFCFQRISDTTWPDGIQEAYADEDEEQWVCPKCFEFLKDLFEWNTERSNSQPLKQ